MRSNRNYEPPYHIEAKSDHLIQQYSDEEIDIRVLMLSLCKQWRLIALIITSITFLAIGVVFFLPKTYEIKSIISRPELEDIKKLERGSVKGYSLEEAYLEYFNKLTQMDVARRYFEETEIYKKLAKKEPGYTYSVSDIDNAYSLFREVFRVEKIRPGYLELNKDEKTPLNKVAITFKTRNPAAGAEFINGFIRYAEQQALEKFYKDQSALKQLKKSELEDKITSLKEKTRSSRYAEIATLEEQNVTKIRALEDEIKARVEEARFKREARIAQLKEALFIAKGLGITEPRSLEDFRPLADVKSQIAINTHLNSDDRPLYLLGSQFLSAEIEQLMKRVSDEYFVPGLGELKKELALAKSNRSIEALKQREDDRLFIEELPEIQNQLAALALATLDFSGVKLFTLEQKAYIPESSISPNKSLIAGTAFILSSILALGFALVRTFLNGDFRLPLLAQRDAYDQQQSVLDEFTVRAKHAGNDQNRVMR